MQQNTDSILTANEQCKHCGEACTASTTYIKNLPFCCQGCASVYQILADNNLLKFYTLDQTAGIKQQRNAKQYDWLDLPDISSRFLRYSDEKSAKISIELPSIHCLSCVWLLENLHNIREGVINCKVNYARKRADIFFNPNEISLSKLAELLDQIGYPPKFNEASKKDAPYNKGLFLRMGYAGFAFGNIMLFSFPEYFNISADSSASSIENYISYLILTLSIPVLLYSGSYYLNGAYQGLKHKYISFDVPIALGMLALFGQSVYEIMTHSGAGYFDSLAGLIFFLLIGRWFQSITFSRLNFDRDYKDYFPIAAYKIGTEEQIEPIPTHEIEVGTKLLIQPGQLIPTDGQLINNEAVAINYSFVTGEAKVQHATQGQQVYAGGRAVENALKIVATAKVQDSYLLQLWQSTDDEITRGEDQQLHQISKYFTIVILVVAFLTFLFWSIYNQTYAFQSAVAVLIIACPCALALARPFAYGTLMRLLAQKGLYIRSSHVLDKLKDVEVYVFDKTGTLLEASTSSDLLQISNNEEETLAIFLGMASQSSHPKSKQIAQQIQRLNIAQKAVSTITECTGQGILLSCNKDEYRIGSAKFCGLPNSKDGTFLMKNNTIHACLKADNNHFRPGIKEMLRSLDMRKKYLLSGDDQASLEMWRPYFNNDRIRFRQSPFDKQAYLSMISDRKSKAIMVGDGLNDTGALQTAHVGIAVAETTADFSPACDGIIIANQLRHLPRHISNAKKLSKTLSFSYLLAFIYNAIGLFFAISGQLSPVIAAILMPISSISVVLLSVSLTSIRFHSSHKSDIYH